MSCDQAIFVDQAAGASVFSDAAPHKTDRFRWRFQRRGAMQGAVRPVLIVVRLVVARIRRGSPCSAGRSGEPGAAGRPLRPGPQPVRQKSIPRPRPVRPPGPRRGNLGDRLGQANALHRLGDVRRLTGDFRGAAQALEEALSIRRDIGDRGGEAETLNASGELRRARGDLGGAEACHQRALGLAREIGSSWDVAQALAGLGRCALAAGRTSDAKSCLRQAQEIFQRLGAAEAPGLGAELDAIP